MSKRSSGDVEVTLADHVSDHQLLDEHNEPVVCNHFGCGRELSLQEKLYGNKCIKHSMPGKVINTGKCFTNGMRLSVMKSVYVGIAANAGCRIALKHPVILLQPNAPAVR